MSNTKSQTEEIIEQEAESLLDAIADGSIRFSHLLKNHNFGFLGERLAATYNSMDNANHWQLDNLLAEHVDSFVFSRTNSGFDSPDEDGFFINLPEIECQFESLDQIEDLDEWVVNDEKAGQEGHTFEAYLYLGNGLNFSIPEQVWNEIEFELTLILYPDAIKYQLLDRFELLTANGDTEQLAEEELDAFEQEFRGSYLFNWSKNEPFFGRCDITPLALAGDVREVYAIKHIN